MQKVKTFKNLWQKQYIVNVKFPVRNIFSYTFSELPWHFGQKSWYVLYTQTTFFHKFSGPKWGGGSVLYTTVYYIRKITVYKKLYVRFKKNKNKKKPTDRPTFEFRIRLHQSDFNMVILLWWAMWPISLLLTVVVPSWFETYMYSTWYLQTIPVSFMLYCLYPGSLWIIYWILSRLSVCSQFFYYQTTKSQFYMYIIKQGNLNMFYISFLKWIRSGQLFFSM